MKKKEITEDVVEESVAETSGIAEFTGDFGREDFNALRDKVNEVIRVINSF